MTTQHQQYLESIRACYPHLEIGETRWHNSDGQFNEVLFLNNTLIFRFPRSAKLGASFATQIQLLEWLQPYLSLPIPRPVFQNLDKKCGEYIFMGYTMLPGQPFRPETLQAIQDEARLDHLARQLATFLQELHHSPITSTGLTLPVDDGRQAWVKMYDDFRTHLFPYMRPDAQRDVTVIFDKFLNDPRQFYYPPALRHGDFGPSNILYDAAAQSISGIIDFDSIAIGDPALDVGAILNLGEDFFSRMCRIYPELAAMRQRTEFYRSTYALQEALYGLQLGVAESFEAGIAAYR